MDKTATLLHEVTEFQSGLLDGRGTTDMCFVVCAALEGYLNFSGRACKVVKGEVNGCNHFWIALPDGRIIDPTADQFPRPNGPPMPKVYIGPLPAWYQKASIKELTRSTEDILLESGPGEVLS